MRTFQHPFLRIPAFLVPLALGWTGVVIWAATGWPGNVSGSGIGWTVPTVVLCLIVVLAAHKVETLSLLSAAWLPIAVIWAQYTDSHLDGYLSVLRFVGPSVFDPASAGLIREPITRLALGVGTVSLAHIGLWFAGSPRGKKDLHGSARWGTERDAREAGLLAEGGVVLGTLGRAWVRVEDLVHVLLIAGTRSGKTSTTMATTALSPTIRNLISLDPKGELLEISAGYRSRFSRVIEWNPAGGAGRWNPLLEIGRGPDGVKKLQVLAEALIPDPPGKESDSAYWIGSARELFVALALHLIWSRDTPTLWSIRTLINDPKQTIEQVCKSLLEFEHDPEGRQGWTLGGEPTLTHPEVSLVARRVLNMGEKNERGAVAGTLTEKLRFLADEGARDACSQSSFRLSEIYPAEEPVSVYLTPMVSDLAHVGALVRMFLSLLTYEITHGGYEDWSRRKAPERRFHLLVDEFPALGRLQLWESVLSMLAGYGVTAVLAVQDLSQIKRLYGAKESLTGNCGVRVVSRTASIETARAVTDWIGKTTVSVQRQSLSSRGVNAKGEGSNVRVEDIGRLLIDPAEVQRLPIDQHLVIATGAPPFRVTKRPYFKERKLQGRAHLERRGEAA